MTDAPFPLLYEGGGKFIAPSTFFCNRADERFTEGERYQMVEHHERSGPWHRAYFAQINEAHSNLPEGMDEDFPSPDHLRKFALIKCGFHDKIAKSFSSPEDALKASAFAHTDDDYAIVTVEGCMVTRYTAKSQDYRHMDKAEFRKSAEAVLAYVWDLCGVDPETGNANAGSAA